MRNYFCFLTTVVIATSLRTTLFTSNIKCLGGNLRYPIFVPVLHNLEESMAKNVVTAISSSHIQICSVSLRHNTAMDALNKLRQHAPREIILGASTVVSEKQIVEAHQLGANFVSSMFTPQALIRTSQAIDIPLLGGVSNVYDAKSALSNNIDSLKFYPATNISPPQLKIILDTLGTVKPSIFIAGNVKEDQYFDYIRIGVQGFAIGVDCLKYPTVESLTNRLISIQASISDATERYVKRRIIEYPLTKIRGGFSLGGFCQGFVFISETVTLHLLFIVLEGSFFKLVFETHLGLAGLEQSWGPVGSSSLLGASNTSRHFLPRIRRHASQHYRLNSLTSTRTADHIYNRYGNSLIGSNSSKTPNQQHHSSHKYNSDLHSSPNSIHVT
eukprot:gene10376-21647_t